MWEKPFIKILRPSGSNGAPSSPGESDLNKHDGSLAVPTPEPSALVGALDIVESFTALRHEVKLQVRSGRELQQGVMEGFQQIEAQLSAASSREASALSHNSARELAKIVAEVDEYLQNAVSFCRATPMSVAHTNPLACFDRAIQSAPWWAIALSKRLVGQLRNSITQGAEQSEQAERSRQNVDQGLQLLLERVRRLMRDAELERVDVLRQPFDPERMRAVGVVDPGDVPSNHVAEQLRPGYLWRGELLRYADVRIAK